MHRHSDDVFRVDTMYNGELTQKLETETIQWNEHTREYQWNQLYQNFDGYFLFEEFLEPRRREYGETMFQGFFI